MGQKPIIHGPDHRLGGADPIPGFGGIQFAGPDPVYGDANVGDSLSVETLDTLALGIFFQNDGDGGIGFYDRGSGGVGLYEQGTGTAGIFANGGGNIQLVNSSSSGSPQIDIYNSATGSGGIWVSDSGGGGIDLYSASSDLSGHSEIQMDSGFVGIFISSTNQIGVSTGGGPIFLNDYFDMSTLGPGNTGAVQVRILGSSPDANTFVVAEAAADGSIPATVVQYMQIGCDGVLHLPSNGSVAYDLPAV